MPKRTAIILCLIFSTINHLFAQDKLTDALKKDSKKDTKTWQIQSLDGKSQTIHIMPDYAKHILKISCLKDTITDNDFWSVPVETCYLNKHFLKINYEVRGDSNLGLGTTFILCVNGNRLYEALHILRYSDWESGDLTKAYSIKLTLVNYKRNYALKASIDDKVISINDPETNYHYTNSTEFHFDKKLKVFYSVKDDLNDTLKICYPGNTYKREIQGTFPKVLLGKNEYIFIGGQWFECYYSTLTKY